MAETVKQIDDGGDEFEKAIRQIAAMPYYTLPLNEAAVDSLFKRYNKAIAIADDAIAAHEAGAA
jgi:hypothetical protein